MEVKVRENIKREFKIFGMQICIHLSKIHCFYITKYKHTYYDVVQWFHRFLQIFAGPIVFNDKYILSFYVKLVNGI